MQVQALHRAQHRSWGKILLWIGIGIVVMLLIFLIGYFTFFVVAFWVFDMKKMKSKLITVGSIWAFDILALIVFIPVSHWI